MHHIGQIDIKYWSIISILSRSMHITKYNIIVYYMLYVCNMMTNQIPLLEGNVLVVIDDNVCTVCYAYIQNHMYVVHVSYVWLVAQQWSKSRMR